MNGLKLICSEILKNHFLEPLNKSKEIEKILFCAEYYKPLRW